MTAVLGLVGNLPAMKIPQVPSPSLDPQVSLPTQTLDRPKLQGKKSLTQIISYQQVLFVWQFIREQTATFNMHSPWKVLCFKCVHAHYQRHRDFHK